MNVLAVAGSLRANSYNKMLIRSAQKFAPEGMNITFFDLEGIPLFNQDLEEQGLPERVQELRVAIHEADALLLSVPEYNFSISGVMKNALDWMSRTSSVAPEKPLKGKRVGMMGASMSGFGTARAQTQMRMLASVLMMDLYNLRPDMHVSVAQEKFDGEGRLIDDRTKEQLIDYLKALYTWLNK